MAMARHPSPASLIPPLPPHAPPLPELPTLLDWPSWCNFAGRIDRAACLELPVSAVWRRAAFDAARERRRATPGFEVAGAFRATTYFLEDIHRSREPRQLRGDFRWKANVMQPTERHAWDRDRRWRRSLKSQTLQAPPSPEYMDHGLTANPNKGATRTKILGLAERWEQNLRVERWVQGKLDPHHENLPPNLVGNPKVGLRRHFLACPGKAMKFRSPIWIPHPCQLAKRERNPRTGGDPLTLTPRQREWFAIGREPYREPCSGKAYKLFLPLCTKEEWRDAEAARQWVAWYRSLRPNAPGSELEALLIARYATLWEPCVLLCAKCLGLKYGDVRFEKRTAMFALPRTDEHGKPLRVWDAAKRLRIEARKEAERRRKTEIRFPGQKEAVPLFPRKPRKTKAAAPTVEATPPPAPPMERPEDISDEDWTIAQARAAWMQSVFASVNPAAKLAPEKTG